jgi:hypothetical protein
MVKKYADYLTEGKNDFPLIYSVITALAVFKPEYFDFLNSMKNRFFLTDNSFWQGLIIEIKKTPQIKLEKQHLINIKGINIESDWIKLKKCFEASLKIKEKFSDVSTIRIMNDGGLVCDNNIIRSKGDTKISITEIEKFLGFTARSVYTHDNWDMLVIKWVELMKEHLKEDFLKHYIHFLDSIGDLSWESYRNFKLKGLGIKIEELPKLYYNSFYDLNIDMSKTKDVFKNFELFLSQYLDIKNDILNKGVLYPLVKENQHRYNEIHDILVKHHAIADESYFRFDSKMNIIEVPSRSEWSVSNDIKERFLINQHKDFIIELTVDNNNIKFLIGLKHLAPSVLNIKCKIKESKESEL